MKIPTKEEYFKNLRSDPLYRSILKNIPNEERKRAIETIEHIAGSILEGLTLAAGAMKQDPNIEQELIEAMKTGDGIIKESDGSSVVQKKNEEK